MALLQASSSVSCMQKVAVLAQRPARNRASASLSPTILKGIPPLSSRCGSSFFNGSSLLKVRKDMEEAKGGGNRKGGACLATGSVNFSAETLRWIFAGAAAVLLFLRNASITRSFLVPLLALQAPRDVVSAVRGEYGIWTAFLAILVRLFYHIPVELELPLAFVLLLITAPLQILDFRVTTAALVVTASLAAYLAYQHVNGTGGVKESVRGEPLLATLAITILVVVPIVIFFGGY